jgi:hypothetical protein
MGQIGQASAAKSATPASAAATNAVQRKCGCGAPSRSGEECSECARKRQAVQRRTLEPGQARNGRPQAVPPHGGQDFSQVRVRRPPVARVQPRLTVTAPRDEYEQEADRVAETVCGHSRGAAIHSRAPRISAFVPRDAREEDPGRGEAGADVPPALELDLMRAAGSGQPLPAAVRDRMEAGFGVRFGGVRVHTGGDADRLASDIDALAFTHGRHIFFSAGAYAPGTAAGDRLLAHELTHVVQQSGGISAPAPNVVQRGFSGLGFHAGTEKRFLAANKGKGLLTEAPLPGATTGTAFDFVKVGFPDLYKSDTGNVAIGVRGEWDTPEDVNPSDNPDKKRRYVPLGPRERKAKSDAGPVTYSPTPQGDTQPFTAEFPNSIEVGDIKPIWTVGGKPVVTKSSEGVQQLGNYQNGIKEFVRTAAADKKVNRGTIGTTGVLTGLKIPPELDYKDFEKQNKTPSPNVIGTEDRAGRRRYWMFEPPNTGLYYYFHLADPDPSPQARKTLEEAFKQLEPVKHDLRTPDDGIHNKLKLPQTKRRSGAKKTPPVQRKETPRVKKDWGALGKAWEEKRLAWDQKYGKPFVASKEGKALDERVAIDKVLEITQDASLGSIADLSTHLKSVELWSGRTGMLLGALRFRLGTAFDKVAGAFDWIKGKLTGFWNKLSGAKSPEFGFGWRKILGDLLFKAVKLGFRELVSVFFELCANCVEGIINKIVLRFKEDISENLREQIEALHTAVNDFEARVKGEFESRFGSWNRFIDDLSTTQQLVSVVLSLEALIRLGLQAVSCLSPPALGCLWGLVAQVGLEVALDLIMGTEWFQEHVINHPTVRGLIKQFAGPTIRSLIADTLRAIHLDEYAKDVEPCTKVKELDAPPVPPVVEPIPPARFAQHRADWEAKNSGQMLQDLRLKFETRPGVPATRADLESLVAAIARSGLKPDATMTPETARAKVRELQKIFDASKRWDTGARDPADFRRRLSSRGDSEEGQPGSGGGPFDKPPRRPGLGVSEGAGAPDPRIKAGPQVFEPPPGSPPGQGGPTLPGGVIRF